MGALSNQRHHLDFYTKFLVSRHDTAEPYGKSGTKLILRDDSEPL